MIILKIFIGLSKKIFIVSIIYEWYFERFFILVWWKTTVNPLENIFFVFFVAFFFRLGKIKKTTVNPFRNNFDPFFLRLGGGIKKLFSVYKKNEISLKRVCKSLQSCKITSFAYVSRLVCIKKQIDTWLGTYKTQALHIGTFPYVIESVLIYPGNV